MSKMLIIQLIAVIVLSVCSCAGSDVKKAEEKKVEDNKTEAVPEIHAIAYDESMDTLEDEGGADAFNHTLDHADSRYYKIIDFYNMESDETLHILPHFETYQQTTEYSKQWLIKQLTIN